MPIKKRTEKIGPFWRNLRAKFWKDQNGYRLYDFHASKMRDGSEQKKSFLKPKPILFYKDEVHCANAAQAREMVRKVAACHDVTGLELKGRWVYVEHDTQGYGHELPGQVTDPREKITG